MIFDLKQPETDIQVHIRPDFQKNLGENRSTRQKKIVFSR